MGDTDDGAQSAVARLERRIDRMEEHFTQKFDRMNASLDTIKEGQAEARSQSSDMIRFDKELEVIKQRLKPLERDAPFVQLLTDGLKEGIRKAVIGGMLIYAVTALYPYAPWVKHSPVKVQIEQSEQPKEGK